MNNEKKRNFYTTTVCNELVSYKLFLSDYILVKVVEETTRHTTQCINNSSTSSRMHEKTWRSVTRVEMNTFIGILLILAVVQTPEIRYIGLTATCVRTHA